ncbi:MAG: putative hydrolase of the superfamily [Mycobacteriales bacterium]
MAVDAVVFDWGGTLTPWHTIDFAECWLACGFDRQVAARLRAAEEAVWQRARDVQRSGTLAEVFTAVDVTVTPGLLRSYFDWWEEHTYTDPDVPPLLAALRERGIKVGVLSNTLWPRVEHDRVFRRDGVHHLIDAAVYTSEIEWTKPHPAAFEAVLGELGVTDPAAAVFVGDRPWDDIHGAHGVGLRAVLLPHSAIPDHQRGPVDGEPDAVVHRLAELLPLVDGWR